MGYNLSPAQFANARAIIGEGQSMGMSARDEITALDTALTESGLNNDNFGDRDSLGLFQQRSSMGWGSKAQEMNPADAAGMFYSHLEKIGNRNGLPMQMEAQDVQRSAFSDGSNYLKNIAEATGVFNQLQGSKADYKGFAGSAAASAGGAVAASAAKAAMAPHLSAASAPQSAPAQAQSRAEFQVI